MSQAIAGESLVWRLSAEGHEMQEQFSAAMTPASSIAKTARRCRAAVKSREAGGRIARLFREME
jgi:hypothetical protein